MTEQEKELLLKDLCARLQYGFKYQVQYGDTSVRDVKKFILDGEYSLFDTWMVHEIKPYLRPMSSMTEEEEKEYIDIVNYKGGLLDYALTKRRNEKYSIPTFTCCIQWLLKRHFDVNNLIPMNLALPAPEGMYN